MKKDEKKFNVYVGKDLLADNISYREAKELSDMTCKVFGPPKEGEKGLEIKITPTSEGGPTWPVMSKMELVNIVKARIPAKGPIITTGTPEDFLKGRGAKEVIGCKALDTMIDDEEKAGPEYEKLADTLVPIVDTPCKAKFIRLLMEEHAADESKHARALKKLKEMIC